jgi:hypothetical protein
MVDMAKMDQKEIANEIRDHIERKIRVADLHFKPFPHMIINDILPRDVYQAVLDLNLFKLEEGDP